MLSRSQRLSVEQFDTVMEKGRVIHSPLFLVRYLKDCIGVRIAAVAPKKSIKNAVDRNNIRRRIYEATKSFKENISHGTHIIIFAKTQTKELEQTAIITDLKNLFVKSGLLS